MEKRWESKNISLDDANELTKKLGIPLAVSKLLVSIGIIESEDAVKFLKPNLDQLHNPFLLKDMDKAVERINRAIDNGEKILGHGDYDCDGVTTTSLLEEGFRLLGIEIDVFAPNRFKDGYGLNPKRIKGFAEEYDLIISGDTGIRAFPAATLVKEIGHADLIVTDHHEPHIVEALAVDSEAEKSGAVSEIIGNEKIYLPDCYAVVDQQRLGDPYPFKGLAGVGVVFKLMQALFISRKVDMKPLLYLLDLVATGTIADLAPQIDRKSPKIDFENRVLCKYGIAVMNQKPKPWVKGVSIATSLKKMQENDSDNDILYREPFFEEGELIDSTAIGFRIGPLLNAPGRLEDPMPSVSLLLEKNQLLALEKARELKKVNTKRQSQTKTYEAVIKALEESPDEHKDFGIVVQSDEFHIGIAGLVAGKLQQHYFRPAIAMAPVEKDGKIILKGSARSIPGVPVLPCLDYCKEKIGHYEYGGHEQAAGLSLEPHQFDAFRSAFREACMRYDRVHFTPCITYDTEISFPEVNTELLNTLALFEPYGEGMFKNETKKPLFRANDVNIVERKEIMKGKGCILTLQQGNWKCKAITFKDGEKVSELYQNGFKNVDILFHPVFNSWNGNQYIQLMLEDMKPHSDINF